MHTPRLVKVLAVLPVAAILLGMGYLLGSTAFTNQGSGPPLPRRATTTAAGAARTAFEQWAWQEGVPYRNVTCTLLGSDETFATVQIIGELRRSSDSPWQEEQGTVECRKIGQAWKCDAEISFSPIAKGSTATPGSSSDTVFELPVGLRVEEVAALLEQAGVIPASDFIAALKQEYSYSFLADRPAGASLEGYLFPTTYTFPPGVSATQVVDAMLRGFDQNVGQAIRDQARQQGKTVYEIVTLASIVERERYQSYECPLIASVFVNRLQAGMNLQADATVQYSLGYFEPQERWWPELIFSQLGVESLDEIDNPYNTYRYAGLPPGPICSPGLVALQAALSPAESDYYYFVAKRDGSGEHAFARTWEEHEMNVAYYLGPSTEPTATLPLDPGLLPITAVVVIDTAHVRDMPSTEEGDIIDDLHLGDKVLVYGGTQDSAGEWWYLVRLAEVNSPATVLETLEEGSEGWMHHSVVTGSEGQELIPPVAAVETARALEATPTPIGASPRPTRTPYP